MVTFLDNIFHTNLTLRKIYALKNIFGPKKRDLLQDSKTLHKGSYRTRGCSLCMISCNELDL
jgi:hypothetical protein